MKALKLASASLLLAAAGCNGAGRYDQNDLQLVTAYTAKDFCSCMFVMGRDEAYCRAWTKANPQVARIEVDVQHKLVRTSALTLWSGAARWKGEREGCVNE
jgi:hypothetical protein